MLRFCFLIFLAFFPLIHWLLKSMSISTGQVAQLVGALSHTPKGCRFDPWSGHIPKLWLWSSVGVQLIDVSLSHRCFSPSGSPPPYSLSKSMNRSLGEDLNKRNVCCLISADLWIFQFSCKMHCERTHLWHLYF